MPILKSQDMDRAAWHGKLQAISAPQPAWMIIETPEECRLAEFSACDIPPASYRGRIFSPAGEWKWRLLPHGIYRCVFLGEDDWSGLDGENCGPTMLANLEAVSGQVVLWGEIRAGQEVWIEKGVPHRFAYPLPEKIPGEEGRVGLEIEYWRDCDSWEIHFSRYRRIDVFQATTCCEDCDAGQD